MDSASSSKEDVLPRAAPTTENEASEAVSARPRATTRRANFMSLIVFCWRMYNITGKFEYVRNIIRLGERLQRHVELENPTLDESSGGF
ncbi:hypothetical protein G7046_g621 [Stylonectria norvegica]|nr:hypothetical protein G7046_g621 [Stylonectria norvegica]